MTATARSPINIFLAVAFAAIVAATLYFQPPFQTDIRLSKISAHRYEVTVSSVAELTDIANKQCLLADPCVITLVKDQTILAHAKEVPGAFRPRIAFNCSVFDEVFGSDCFSVDIDGNPYFR